MRVFQWSVTAVMHRWIRPSHPSLSTHPCDCDCTQQTGMLVLVVLMATAGKFIGCAGTARINGIPLRESAVIGMYVLR